MAEFGLRHVARGSRVEVSCDMKVSIADDAEELVRSSIRLIFHVSRP